MKSKILKKLLPVLLLAAAVGCTNGTKTDNRQPIPAAPHDTVYPQFPGGSEALDKHLKEIKETILIQIDTTGKASYVNYGSRIITNDNEATQIIASMPRWTPGTLDGRPADFCFVYSNDEKAPLNRCVNAGESQRHHLQKLWTLCNSAGSKGIKNHPIYKDNDIHISFNHYYNLLHTTGTNESEYLNSEVSDTKNEFTIKYNENTAITYRYSVSNEGDILATSYTDNNGKEQTLIWINVAAITKRKTFGVEPERNIPLPPPAKQIIEILEIVESDTEIEESEIMSVEDQGEITEISSPDNKSTDGETIHQVVEQQPEFPGGMQALMIYLRDNINYPCISRDNNSQGKSYISFVVNTDGSIQYVEVMKSSGDEHLDNEAIRVVSTMPKWKPGKQSGKAVRVRFTLPVVFRLQ